MIDIILIKINSKIFSVKCKLKFDEDETVFVKIIGLDQVQPISSSSVIKIKTVFESEGGSILSKIKYPYIYNEVIKKLIQKYRMKVINI